MDNMKCSKRDCSNSWKEASDPSPPYLGQYPNKLGQSWKSH